MTGAEAGGERSLLRRVLGDRRVWLALAVIGLILVLRWIGLGEWFSIDTLRAHRATLVAWVEAYPILAGAAYVLTYIVAVALSLPGALALTITGGFLFGTITGTILTVVGATVGATLVFLFAKRVFGENALDRFGTQAAKLAAGLRRDSFSYLLALRLVPLFPFVLVNLVPAFVGMRRAPFIAATALGIVPGTAVYSLAGAGLGSVLDRGGEVTLGSVLTVEIIAGLVGLAVLALVAVPIRRRLENRAGPAAKA